MDPIEKWRKKIDEIDAQLVHLLNERAKYAEEIGKLKAQLGLEAYSPDREEEIMNNVANQNSGPLSSHALRRLYERIIDESRAVERASMKKGKSSTPKTDSR
jgi:chorismate mutase-like protein